MGIKKTCAGRRIERTPTLLICLATTKQRRLKMVLTFENVLNNSPLGPDRNDPFLIVGFKPPQEVGGQKMRQNARWGLGALLKIPLFDCFFSFLLEHSFFSPCWVSFFLPVGSLFFPPRQVSFFRPCWVSFFLPVGSLFFFLFVGSLFFLPLRQVSFYPPSSNFFFSFVRSLLFPFRQVSSFRPSSGLLLFPS